MAVHDDDREHDDVGNAMPVKTSNRAPGLFPARIEPRATAQRQRLRTSGFFFAHVLDAMHTLPKEQIRRNRGAEDADKERRRTSC